MIYSLNVYHCSLETSNSNPIIIKEYLCTIVCLLINSYVHYQKPMKNQWFFHGLLTLCIIAYLCGMSMDLYLCGMSMSLCLYWEMLLIFLTCFHNLGKDQILLIPDHLRLNIFMYILKSKKDPQLYKLHTYKMYANC